MNFLNEQQLKITLMINHIWDDGSENNMKEITKTIEDLKIELFDSFFNPTEHKKIREQLRMAEKKHIDMLQRKHTLDYITLEGYADFVKQRFIMSHTTYNLDGTRLWSSYNEANPFTLDKLVLWMNSNRITPEEFRVVSRSEPWKTMWSTSKDTLFSEGLTEDQQMLVMYSKMYDGAYDHPECPPDDVIEDDDMFDGWMIKNRRKSEKSRMESLLNNKHSGNKHSKHTDRMANAHDVFLPAKSSEEAKAIDKMNDAESSIIKKQREVMIRKRGKVNEAELPDQQRALTRKSNELFMSQRGK